VQLELLIALLLIIPIIMFFAVFIWYLNIAGIYSILKQSRQKGHAVARDNKLETGQAEYPLKAD